jgi:hypothetical protein
MYTRVRIMQLPMWLYRRNGITAAMIFQLLFSRQLSACYSKFCTVARLHAPVEALPLLLVCRPAAVWPPWLWQDACGGCSSSSHRRATHIREGAAKFITLYVLRAVATAVAAPVQTHRSLCIESCSYSCSSTCADSSPSRCGKAFILYAL